MENDRDANYSENMNTSGKPYEDLTDSADTGQNVSFFKDDESKAWERKLMAPDLGLDAAALQMSKETRSFLWKAGTVVQVRQFHRNPAVKASGTGQCRIKGFRTVGSRQDHNAGVALKAVHFGE